MPQLPFAGFTADTRVGRPGAPGPIPRARIPAPVEPKSGAAAISQFGREVSRFGTVLMQRAEEQEARRVQVETARQSAAFAEEVQVAIETGQPFEPIAEKYLTSLDNLSDGLETTRGAAQLDLARTKMEAGFAASIRSAEITRAKKESAVQSRDMVNILGAAVTADPAGLETAILESDEFIDTFGNLSAEDREILKQSTANELTVAAGNSMLRKDPLQFQEVLNTEGALPDLTPSQRAQFMGRIDSELRRRQNEAGSKDEMGKLLMRQALAAEAEDHVLTNDEAPDWFAQGVTAAQFDAAQKQSIAFQEARDRVDANVRMIGTGGGAVLSDQDYENALQKFTLDATKGMEPEEAVEQAMNIRLTSAVQNGRSDKKIRALINAGPNGSDATFQAGLELRGRMQAESPELYHKMVDSKARMWYNAYDFMTQELGVEHDAARGRLLEFDENRKEAEARLASKENRELVEDAVDIEFQGQTMIIRNQVKDRAVGYMALVPTLTPEQAVNLAAKDFEESTVEINQGVRTKRSGVPVDWEEADDFARGVVLRQDLEDQNIPFDEDELEDYIIIPNNDKTATVIGPDNLTIFTNWNWQGAVDEWRVTVRQPDIEAQQRLAREKRERFEEQRRAVASGILEGAAGIGGI